MSTTIPTALVRDILEGRCVAFLGAGFTAPAGPKSWMELLRRISQHLPADSRARLAPMIDGASTALDYEGAGQMLRVEFGDDERFEQAVKASLEVSEVPPVMQRRLDLLAGIPFEAVLTLNMDGLLRGDTPAQSEYASILRGSSQWWTRAGWDLPHALPRRPVLKLHGDANGQPDDNPVVLARSDYRRRMHGENRYANFLRSVFATRTVLFMGVSFTDAYLNELRSEILSLIHHEEAAQPIAYAILPDKSPEFRDYFRKYEGIEILHFDSRGGTDFSGFEHILGKIHEATAPTERIRALLGGARVVWIDHANVHNAHGHELLEAAGVGLEMVSSPSDLDKNKHASAKLIITRFGFDASGEHIALRVLREIGTWGDRPPVVVFADAEHAALNRSLVLRHGAHEYASGWSELFRVIEQLFGRELGR